jgi:hypothetical protein
MKRLRKDVSRIVILLAFGTVAISPTTVRAQGYRASLPAFPRSIMMDTLRQDHDLKADPGAVYTATLAAFKEFGIEVAAMDSAAGIVANSHFKVPHFFAGAVTSRSFDCGEGTRGPKADSWSLQLAIVAFINPAPGGGTKLGIAAAGSASDPAGASRDPVACASTGVFETKIASLIAKKTGQ